MPDTRIGIVGAGAWGTALAGLTAANGHQTVLWGRSPDLAENLARTRSHPSLPGVALHPNVRPTSDLDEIARSEAIVFAVPAQSIGGIAESLAPRWPDGSPAIVTAKGIEQTTGRLMHEVVAESIPTAEPAILSGPSFAIDVARGLPTAVTLAAADLERARALVGLFAGASFRPYASDDLVGVAAGGAVKNVLAIAAGIVAGRGLGESAGAALIARGLAEMTRLGESLGARRATFSGLSGLGDLVLTATSARSRNMAFGMALGRGRPLAEATAAGTPLVEGYHSAGVVADLARRNGVEMPIAEAVAAVLTDGVAIDGAIASLLDRPLRTE